MITPYLTFNGKCKDALDFYRAVFDYDEPKVMPYGDYMPEWSETPPELLRDWVMHGEMSICGTNVWFADEAAPPVIGNSIKLTVSRRGKRTESGSLQVALLMIIGGQNDDRL
jgi:PhnB protein